MQIDNEFKVNVPVEQAWTVLTDLPRIAPCMPGATLEEVDGDAYLGNVRVKVGPMVATYQGKATWERRDEAARQAVVRAEGREKRGGGNASATITATLTDEGGATGVKVVTDLTITGKVAQFGRSALAEVSNQLLTQFVTCLESDLLGTGNGGASGAGDTPASDGATDAGGAIRTDGDAPVPPKEPVDLVIAFRPAVIRRAVPVIVGLLVVLTVFRRRRSGGGR